MSMSPESSVVFLTWRGKATRRWSRSVAHPLNDDYNVKSSCATASQPHLAADFALACEHIARCISRKSKQLLPHEAESVQHSCVLSDQV